MLGNMVGVDVVDEDVVDEVGLVPHRPLAGHAKPVVRL
jgi:hypothetical protein